MHLPFPNQKIYPWTRAWTINTDSWAINILETWSKWWVNAVSVLFCLAGQSLSLFWGDHRTPQVSCGSCCRLPAANVKPRDVSVISIWKSVFVETTDGMQRFRSKRLFLFRIWKKKRRKDSAFSCFFGQKVESCLHCKCNVEQSRLGPRPADELKTYGQPALILPNLAC